MKRHTYIYRYINKLYIHTWMNKYTYLWAYSIQTRYYTGAGSAIYCIRLYKHLRESDKIMVTMATRLEQVCDVTKEMVIKNQLVHSTLCGVSLSHTHSLNRKHILIPRTLNIKTIIKLHSWRNV